MKKNRIRTPGEEVITLGEFVVRLVKYAGIIFLAYLGLKVAKSITTGIVSIIFTKEFLIIALIALIALNWS